MKPQTFFDVVAAMRNRMVITVMDYADPTNPVEANAGMPHSITSSGRVGRHWTVNIGGVDYLWPEDNTDRFRLFGSF